MTHSDKQLHYQKKRKINKPVNIELHTFTNCNIIYNNYLLLYFKETFRLKLTSKNYKLYYIISFLLAILFKRMHSDNKQSQHHKHKQ